MVNVLERGNIYFAYRPRVEHESVERADDLQRTYMILSPHGKDRYRRIILGQQQLPDIHDGGERVWGFVDKVARESTDIVQDLERETYQTKTRGEREQPAARPAGEGVYAIINHEDHTHLAYALELPESPGEVQKELNIEPESSHILSVKNPEQPSPRGAGLSGQKADFPNKLQNRFHDRRFIAVDPPDFLDHEGAELLLVGASDDISEELGITLNAQEETAEKAEIFNDLRMRKTEHPIEPLFEGEWR